MTRFLPRTIRSQLIAGTVLLQFALVLAVMGNFYRVQRRSLEARTQQRLFYQVRVLRDAAAPEITEGYLPGLQSILDTLPADPTISAARITELSGRNLAYSDRVGPKGYSFLTPQERAQIHPPYTARIFESDRFSMEAMAPVLVDGTPVALAWIYPDMSQDHAELANLLRTALILTLLGIFANAVFSVFVAGTITRPLRALLRGTKMLARNPEHKGVFPLKVRAFNEAGELTQAFNAMVAALDEQRSGLNDTLSLLDSMLANAPVGFAFFDRATRFARVNRFFAEMDHLPVASHLGHPLSEVFPARWADETAANIRRVFETGQPVRDVELSGESPGTREGELTWVISFYPVRTGAVMGAEQVRWVGAVVLDATERSRAEEALRRTEKLAATGRLAASIAHEINNPLEAITNLLYLLRHQPSLDAEALQDVEMAQRELARVSQITQQTLRFYRQSSLPVSVNICDIMESVLALYQGRLHATEITVVRRYSGDVQLLAFSGELRQLFANLIGNAFDALARGGRLVLCVRESHLWSDPAIRGLRIVVADTGCGMGEDVRRRIFEAFFTTKEATGTGLGLWVSSGIVEKHRGTIRVRSRPADLNAQNPADLDAQNLNTQNIDGRSAGASGSVFMLFFPFDGVKSGMARPVKSESAAAASAAG